MITRFSRTFLSNFWPVRVVLDGVEYPTVEHAYQAAKTLDSAERRRILAASTAGRAKKLGRRTRIRPDWDAVKLDVMRDLLMQKFSCDSLRSALLATGDAPLVEVNTWSDYFWGVCNGIGENHLGKLLMQLRTQLRG
jgi:ribA/ribD-fused uncharacterized protein